MNARKLAVVGVIGLVAALGAVALLAEGGIGAPPAGPAEPLAADPLELDLVSIATESSTARSATVRVVFEATNPTDSTMILQYVKYTASTRGERVHTDIIGERPSGFVASSNFYTLVGGQSATLSDEFEIRNTGGNAELWESVRTGLTEWRVTAEASYGFSSVTAGGEIVSEFAFGG